MNRPQGREFPKYVEKTWNILDDAINEIFNHKATTLSLEDLYRYAYHMILHKCGEQLYSGLVSTITSHLQDIANSIDDVHGDAILENLNKKWSEYYKALLTICDILMYPDRTYIPATHKTPILELGLYLWRENVVPSKKILDILIEHVHRERNGECINRGLMRESIKMLMRLGYSVYQDEFEKKFLEISADFYCGESHKLVESCDCGEYLKKVEMFLYGEMERVSSYLYAKTEPKNTYVVEKEMIENHIEVLVHMENSGLIKMIVDDKYKDLGRMYNLFCRVPDGLLKIRDVFVSHFRDSGEKLVSDPERLKDPIDFVQGSWI